MVIIPINHPSELPSKYYYCYTAEPNPENAVIQYKEKFGIDLETVYVKTGKTGRCSVYIPLWEFENERT